MIPPAVPDTPARIIRRMYRASPYPLTDLYARWLQAYSDAGRRWTEDFFEGATAAQGVLAQAGWRSVEEARAVLDASGGTDPALPARLGDLWRAQAFLWASSGFAAGERLVRAAPEEVTAGLGASWLSRAAVIGTVTADLYGGYAALRERARWFPHLVGETDRGLQHHRGAARVLDAASTLGGALIKAAQFASSRPDLVPAAYVERLSALQDRVPPRPWDVVEAVITHELKRPLSEVFDHVEPEPVAAASIAQVHRARLTDGREVAVKVRYPDVAALVEADLSALELVFDGLSRLEPEIRLRPIADYLRWTLPLELDFGREAMAMVRLRQVLAGRDDVVVPKVVGSLSTGGLIVMEFVDGVKITDREGLLAAGIDPWRVAELLNDVYADQLFSRRFLHADPHPGNILVQPGEDGPRLVLLDHGLTLSLPSDLTDNLGAMVSAITAGDLGALTPALRRAGMPINDDTDLETLLGVVGVLFGAEESFGDAGFEEFGRRLGRSVGDVPPQLLLVGRAVGLLDGITRQLDPDLDALEIVARRARTP